MPKSNALIKDIKKAIIHSRDQFYDNLSQLLRDNPVVVSLKCNIPGLNKNPWFTKIMLRQIDRLIQTLYPESVATFYSATSGDYLLYTLREEPVSLKNKLIYLESNHPLGRFIDLDVHTKDKTLSRTELETELRRCYICDKPAFECARSKAHSQDELLTTIESETVNYFTDALSEACMQALRKEVYLYPKFGLVSNKNSGAHADMDITHFKQSIQALKPYFKQFIEAGFNETIDESLRDIGIKAEKAMFDATNQINTHKGIIFIFGAILPFLSKGLKENNDLKTVIDHTKAFASEITKADFDHITTTNQFTPGEIIYLKYGLKGIREEVSSGFPSLMHWYGKENYCDYQRLTAIMSRLNDTTIIKRHNYSVLKDVKEEMQALTDEHPFRFDYYTTLSNRYLEKGISPGGAADILALSFLLDFTKHLLKYDRFKL